MTWAPKKQIIDTRFIGRNILSYVSANQVEALNWANDGTDLKSFKQFSESIANRANPIFPSLAILSDGNAMAFDSDVLKSGYEITFEVMISGTDAPNLPLLARKYKHALESILLNISRENLLQDTTIRDSQVSSIETQFDELKTNEMQNSFLQMFQTTVTYMFYT